MIQPIRRRPAANKPEDVIRLLVTVNRLRQRYDKGHSRMDRAVVEFINAVTEFLDGRDRNVFRIVLRDGHLTHDRELMAHGEESVEELARLLTRLECGGIAFRTDLTAASMNALLDWMAGRRGRPAEGTCTGLEFIGASPVDRAATATAPFGLSELDRVFRIAAASRFALEQIFDELRDGHPLDLSQINQLTRWITDGIDCEGRRIAAPVFLGPPDPTPAGHAANVFLLTVALLHTYARNEHELAGFCCAALLHDIGLSRLHSHEAPHRTVRAAVESERHPSIGADLLLGCHDIAPLAIEVAFSHHLMDDNHGFPPLQTRLSPSPVADAVQIADRIERMTGRTPGRKNASFATVCGDLMELPGMRSRRDTIQAFLTDLTPTPPGTLIRVRSGAVGVVLDVNPETPDRPRIALVQDGSGRDLGHPAIIDLGDDSDETLSIAEALPRPPRPLRAEA